MAVQLPGYEWWPLPGVPGMPYDEWDDPKALVHTTQGTSIDGAVTAYRNYPPHLIVDPWKRRKIQHIDLEHAAYALWNEDADDSRCYQIEIVGFAEDSHLWSDDVLNWLGKELALPLHEYAGVPYTVVWKGFKRDGETGYILADPDSPLRLSQYELDHFSGWLGHQHIPGDSHWDPGGLNVHKILQFAQEADMALAPDERALLQEIRNRTASMQSKGFLEVRSDEPRHMGGDLGWFQRQMTIALAPLTARVDAGFNQLTDDEARIIAAVRAQPTGGQVDVHELAPALADVLVPLLPVGIDRGDVEQALANVLRGGTDDVPDGPDA